MKCRKMWHFIRVSSLSSADFFQNQLFFSKNYFRNTIRMSNILDPDQWVQSVCKGYQQMTLGGKELYLQAFS